MTTATTDWDARVRAALGEVVDPCSCMASTPVSIVDLGLVGAVDIGETVVDVTLVLTDPMCMYFIDMADEIRRRVGEAGWPGEVRVHYDTEHEWDATRISPAGNARLSRLRADRVVYLGITPHRYDETTDETTKDGV